MPNVLHADETIETQLANALRRIRQLEKRSSGGFDPNEDPVIIGAGATAGGGSTPSNVSGGEVGSIVIGSAANTSDPTIVPGTNNISIGTNAGVGGYGHDGGDGNIAVGSGSQAGGADDGDGGNVAIGRSAFAKFFSSVAIGDSANAIPADGTSDGAVAVGQVAIALANNATAVGPSSGVRGVNGTALGWGAYVAGYTQSTAIGASAEADDDHQVVLGTSTEYVLMPGNGFVLVASDNSRWRFTTDTSGNLTSAAA